MKYKYSPKYKEAGIISHPGETAIAAAQRLLAQLEAEKKPVLSVIARDGAGSPRMISYIYTGAIAYGRAGDLHFCGFGAAVCGADNNYSDVISRYRIRTL